MTVNGIAVPSLTGDGSALVFGQTWTSVEVTIPPSGELSIGGVSAGDVSCIGLAGFQVAPPSATAVPAMSPPWLAVLAFTLVTAARIMRGRARRRT
jgi:hypothetical protein